MDDRCDLNHPHPQPAILAKDLAEAEIVRALLDAAGIPAVADAEAITSSAGVPVPPIGGGVPVQVPCSRADEARDVIETARRLGKLLAGD